MDPMAIQNHVRSLQGLGSISPSKELPGLRPIETDKAGSIDGKSFGEVLADSVREVNELQQTVDVRMEKLAAGETTNIHETLIEMQRAEVSMKMLLQVRNKMVSAYQEIMRLQV